MKIKLLIILVGIVISSSNITYSQCCAAGNPVSSDGSGNGGGKNILKASVFLKHSYSDTYFQEAEKVDYKYIDYSSLDFTSVSLSYGVTDRINISAELGYFITKSQTFIKPFPYERNAQGLGDGSITAKYSIYRNTERKIEIAPSFRLTLPIGEFDQVYNNVVLPIDIQPSSGNYKYNTGLFLRKGFGDKFSLFSANSFEISQRIQTERTKDYKYGNLYLLSVIGAYKLNKNLTGLLQVRSQIREKSINQGKIIDATGGHVMFIIPQINVNINKGWNISLLAEIPIYKKLNGKQLTNKYAVAIRVSKAIDFNKNRACTDTKLCNTNDLEEYSFKVYGACGMCKTRIENIALKFKEIKIANWNSESNMLTVKFSDRPDFEKLKKSIAKAGHDTDTVKATNKAYAKLHECCKYR